MNDVRSRAGGRDPGNGDLAGTAVSGAQTLLRGLDILASFTTERSSYSIGEMTEAVGLTAPTTHRLLKALVSRGLLVVSSDRRYSLGPAIMQMASVIMHRADNLAALAAPTLERLRDVTGETVSLHCLLGRERICVVELVSAEPIRMESGVGHVYPLYAGAAGKAMLAWLPRSEEMLAETLPLVGPATITDGQELRDELELIRKRGYATSESEVVAGAASLAVPVHGADGALVAAINIAGPATRWDRSKVAQHRPLVLEEVARLRDVLSSSGPLVSEGAQEPLPGP